MLDAGLLNPARTRRDESLSYLDKNGNPPVPTQGDVVAHTKQLVLAEIEILLEIIRQLDQASESGKDLPYAEYAERAMQAAERLQTMLAAHFIGCDGQTAFAKNEEVL